MSGEPIKLRQVKLQQLKREMELNQQPMVATIQTGGSGKRIPFLIALPYSEEAEKKAGGVIQDYKAGDINYDTYKAKMLELGYKQLLDDKVVVRPSDIISSENLEESKKKNKLLATELLLSASNIWARRNERQICTHCGHIMLPEAIINAQNIEDQRKEEENGNTIHELTEHS